MRGELNLIHLAKIMGTSVRELEDTYVRSLGRTNEHVRDLFDEYDAAFGGRLGAETAQTPYAPQRTLLKPSRTT